MKKFKIIFAIIIVLIIILVGFLIFKNFNSTKKIKNNISTEKNTTERATHSSKEKNNPNELTLPTPLFTTEQKDTYYKISTIVGNIGLPSNSLVTNLDNYKTIDGINYYDAYSYATRTSYKGPVVHEDANNNFSGEMNHYNLVGLNGKKLESSNVSSSENTNKLSNEEKYVQIYKIASEYIEGYTANYPNIKVEANDNYEGNLDDVPPIKVDLKDSKKIAGNETYKVTVSINGFNTSLYIGLNGYIFVKSEQDYEQLFFPGWLNQNIPVVKTA